VGNKSGEHGPAMFVLFSDGAIKHEEDRNRFGDLKGWEKKKARKKKSVALLEGIREPSSGHRVNAAMTVQAMAD